MYKPNDIVAVYGEVSHGGTLIYDRHDAPKDENDPILKRYTLMDVVEVKNQDAMIVKRRGGDPGTMFVHPRQCRLVSRNGITVEPKKASLILVAWNGDYTGSECCITEVNGNIKKSYDEIIGNWSDRDGTDPEEVAENSSYRVFKGIEVTEEFDL